MSKLKIKVEKNPVNDGVVVPESVLEVAKEASSGFAPEWPEVTATGKFVAVPFKEGYVVYNPIAQRATGVVSKTVADDIVRQQNQAAQIKG